MIARDAATSKRLSGVLAGAVVLVLVLARGASAGPCTSCAPTAADTLGWWDDRALAPGETADRAPRIDVDGDGVSSRVAIAWERRSGGDGDTWFATSDDGGCTWSSRALTFGSDDDTRPDVAVSRSAGAVLVVFVRLGEVLATASLDGGASFAAPVRVAPGLPADGDSRPRVALVPVGAGFHAHVAWAAGGRIHLAANTQSGDAAAWTAATPSDRFAGFSAWRDADVATDTRSFVVGTDSAVTLVASGLAPGSLTPEVFALRSNDSGATFFGDPATPATADVPRRVSDARPPDDPSQAASGPVLDVSDDGSGEFYTWEVVAYSDASAAFPNGGARIDARAEEGAGPSTIADWNDAGPDHGPGDATRSGTVSVTPNPGSRPPSPSAHFFFEGGPSGGNDASVTRYMLDVNAPGNAWETCPAASLTGLFPPRVSGEVVASSLSADEDLSHVFLAWEDTRDGGSSVYWKRTDTVAFPAATVAAGAASCPGAGGLLVSFDLAAACDVSHVRVDYGRASGAYEASVDVAGGSAVTLTGLSPGATYFVRVTVVDEACNEAAAPEVTGVAASCVPVACPNPVGPTLRAAKRPTADDVELWWVPPPVDAGHDAATSFDVYRAAARPDAGYVLHGNAPSPAFPDAGAASAGQAPRFFYLVVARNACGTSGDEPAP